MQILRIGERDGHPAINVKCYRGFDTELASKLGDLELRDVEESVQAEWWRQAEAEAHELGFDGVFSAGRSGGWLQPFWQTGGPFGGNTGKPWKGQGAEKEFPRFPDMSVYAHRRKVEALARRLARLMNEVPDMFDVEARRLLAEVSPRKEV